MPDPWRASRVAVVIALVSAAVLLWLVAPRAGFIAGVAAGVGVGGIPLIAELQAAWRLRRALAAFASAFS